MPQRKTTSKRPLDYVLDQLSARKKVKTSNSISSLQNKDSTTVDISRANRLGLKSDYERISQLIEHLRASKTASSTRISASVSLCRVFSQLLSDGKLRSYKSTSKHEIFLTKWLTERFEEYCHLLMEHVGSKNEHEHTLSFQLLMELVRGEVNSLATERSTAWTQGLFAKIIKFLFGREFNPQVLREFLRAHVLPYGDVLFYTVYIIKKQATHSGLHVDNIIELLALFDYFENLQNTTPQLLYESSLEPQRAVSPKTQRREAEDLWLIVLKEDFTRAQRKRVLELISYKVAQWFTRSEILMDFLTDSLNSGGSMSLVALSGIFFLMREKNLDYPQFYPKVYSLLDRNFIHSRHRSQALRLVYTFLSSTHLPVALVASFIKKLSRLCLHSPPSGIIAIVPWIYNMMKAHPACAFMIHRPSSATSSRQSDPNLLFRDPFIVGEQDPMKSGAMQSSLWEIETLQTHFHPNVAVIAKIISDQFTKQSYRLEDFTEHNFDTILEAELSRSLKDNPAVEYNIPKNIFLQDQNHGGDGVHRKPQLWTHYP